MIWRPSPTEQADYDELAAWVHEQERGTVGTRLCCPRGHLIAYVGVFLLGHSSRGAMTIQPAMVPDLARFAHKNGFFADDLSPDGFRKVRLLCQHKGCTYRGTHIHDRLALEVARHSRQGHGEFRLTA